MDKTYIIAEIGINHQGDISIAKKLIDIAAAAGCDAVKFQKRNLEIVYGDELLSQEICALYDYLNSTGSKATLISYTSSKTTFPFQSSFIIESNLNYRPDIKRLYVQN